MKNRWKVLLCALLITIVTCSTLLLPSTAKAWKTKTHGYSANLLLKDAEDGKLTVDGVEYTMPDEYKTALEKYPDSFRAGVLGPDFYPDMLTGQSYIHPYDPDSGTGVGDWLKLLVEGVNNMTPGSDDRYNALAFTLGMAVHYAGDMFGHDFINAFAGGAYPAYADAVHDEEKLFYIIRHMAEEAKMDSLIGNRLGDTGVNAPDEFILAKWIYNGSPNGGPAKIYEKYGGMMYQYIYLVNVRAKLFDFTQEYRDSTILAPLVDYIGEWVKDLDTATAQLVSTFDDIAHDFLTKSDGDDAPGDVSIVRNRLNEWLRLYGAKASPAPDFLVDLGNLLSDLADEFMQATGLDYISQKMDEIVGKLVDDAIYGIFDAMGFDYERYANLTKDPQYCLEQADYNEYMTYMNLFSSNAEAFDAFFNTLVMGKLILMGPDSLETFFGNYGVSASFDHTDARVMMDSFDLSIHTKKNSGGSTYGTDDNVILKVYNGNELLLKTVLDNPNENVFENGNYDVFKIGLQKRIYPENLRLELSTDRKYHDEWTLDTVAVKCYSAGSTLYLMSSSLPKVFQYTIALHSGDVLFDEESDVLTLTMPINSMPISRRQYTTALNLSIIDFMWSNDNSSQWVNEDNILWKNTDARKKILYEVFHGFKPKISLSVDQDTFISGDDVKLTVNLASYWNGITKERRDLEYTIPSLNEIKQEACAGPVEVLVQNEQGQPVSTLSGSAGNGVAKISLSGLNPGRYKLVAKYDGDKYNGKAESGPITVNVVEPGNKYKVTYTIQYGTWADGSTDPKTEYVEPGEYPANVPTGMKPSSPGSTSGYWYETDPATTVINKNSEFTYNFILSDVKMYNLTYKIVNGTWSDGSTEAKHQTVMNWTTAGFWSGLGIPGNMKPFHGYGDGSWDNYPTTSLVQNGTKIFTYTFQTLPKFDVTYKVVNGTWANGSTADIVESVMKGYTPSTIPTGMKAAAGFKNGSWNMNPAMTSITAKTTFTYTFNAIPKHTVTYRIVNGTWANGDTDDITETVVDGCYPASVPVGMLPLSDMFTEGSWDINPVDEPVLSPVTYTFTYKPIRTVTYKVVNGTWADGTTDDLTEDVIDGKTPTGFPSGMLASHGYSSGRWDTDPEGTFINGNRTFTWTFSPLPKYTVTYKIVNGTWADSTAADITESVIEGDSPASIPAGMIASHGYKFGGWDIDPEGMVITGNKTFTWTFSALPQYTVTYKVVNGTWADGTAGDVRESVIEGDSPANIPAGMIPAHGYASGSWDHDPAGEAITANRTFTWTFSALPQYTVTYKVVNGTWADGTVRDITESVIEGQYPANIPTGMIADDGFTTGAWDRNPAGSPVTKAETYTWTFVNGSAAYTITCDQNTWLKGSTVGLSFVVHRSVRDDLTFSKFSTLLLNGNPLDARDFNVSAGSLYVTVKPSKLNTLDPGAYRIKTVFTDGEAELVFSVNEGKAVPKTGDSADLMLWTGMLLAGLAVLSTVVVRCRRRRIHR